MNEAKYNELTDKYMGKLINALSDMNIRLTTNP